MNHEKGGQGAIEYLLIIGAAILVVAIVILAITGVLSGGQVGVTSGQGDLATANNKLLCGADLNTLGNVTASALPAYACHPNATDYNKVNCKCCTVFTTTDVPSCR